MRPSSASGTSSRWMSSEVASRPCASCATRTSSATSELSAEPRQQRWVEKGVDPHSLALVALGWAARVPLAAEQNMSQTEEIEYVTGVARRPLTPDDPPVEVAA